MKEVTPLNGRKIADCLQGLKSGTKVGLIFRHGVGYHIYGYRPERYGACLCGAKCCTRDVMSQSQCGQGLRLCSDVRDVGGEAIAACLDDIDEAEIVKGIRGTLGHGEAGA